MSKEAMALLADLVYKQSEVMATELQFFARHANRKIIKTEDVTLLARKQPNLVAIPSYLFKCNTLMLRFV
ncbi:hypothetical protein, variant 5 [Phytophthora nicotianae]|nr:hypothetical protein, variant 5 [Phytophthora nicotianae]